MGFDAVSHLIRRRQFEGPEEGVDGVGGIEKLFNQTTVNLKLITTRRRFRLGVEKRRREKIEERHVRFEC